MAHALAILQGLSLFAALSVPGLVVFGARRWRVRLALLLAVSFMASALAVTVLALVAAKLWPTWGVRVVVWGWTAAAGGLLVVRARRLVGLFRRVRGERWSLAVAGAVALFWLALAPFSPYPGQLYLDLGDAPSYCCEARALLNGHPGHPGYFAADYRSGRLSYLSVHPVPVAAMAFQFALFGEGCPAPLSFNILAGFVLIVLLSDVVNPRPENSGGATNVWFTLALVLIPSHFLYWGLGVVTVNGTLGFAAIAVALLSQDLSSRQRWLIVALALGYMVFSRPEAALLAVCTIVVGIGRFAFRWARNSRLRSRLLLLGVLVSCLTLWWELPALISLVRQVAPELSFLFIRYDRTKRRFKPVYQVPWELNHGNCLLNLNPRPPRVEPSNPAIGEEIRAYPFGFARWLWRCLRKQSALYFTRAVIARQMDFEVLVEYRRLERTLLGIIFLGAALAPGAFPLAVSSLVAMFALPAANLMANSRHLLLFSPVLLALFARAVRARLVRGRPGPRALGIVALVLAPSFAYLAFFDTGSLIEARTDHANTSYTHLFHEIEQLTGPRDLVANAYPQLITWVTGRPSVGGTWFTESLQGVLTRWKPDFVVIDDYKFRNYKEFLHTGATLPGYELVVERKTLGYAIWARRAEDRPRRGAAGKTRHPRPRERAGR